MLMIIIIIIIIIIIYNFRLYCSDVALEIVKNDRWKEALRNTTINNDVIDTPLRKLIRKMPGLQNSIFRFLKLKSSVRYK